MRQLLPFLMLSACAYGNEDLTAPQNSCGNLAAELEVVKARSHRAIADYRAACGRAGSVGCDKLPEHAELEASNDKLIALMRKTAECARGNR